MNLNESKEFVSSLRGAAVQAVQAEVRSSVHGSVRAVRAAVCDGSALGSVWQFVRQRAAVWQCGSVRQCVAVRGSVWQCAEVCGSAGQQCAAERGSAAVRQCAAVVPLCVCGSVAVCGSVCRCVHQYAHGRMRQCLAACMAVYGSALYVYIYTQR
jgi:hypothetical protein